MRKKIIYQILIAALLIGGIPLSQKAQAESCPNLKIVFISDISGGTGTSNDFIEFKNALTQHLQATSLDYEFVDLKYPAVGVGVDNLRKSIESPIDVNNTGQLTSSVTEGIRNLTSLVNNECPNSKYILAGYSEGAMVLSKSLKSLNANKVIYAATFGDPLIYFPEGNGAEPDACKGENLSNYRLYAPDCRTHQGLFGALSPYQPTNFIDKLGVWCNQNDAFCSSRFDASRHTTYVENDIYTHAAKIIMNKINLHYDIEVTESSKTTTKNTIEPVNLQFTKPILEIVNQTTNSDSEVKIEYKINGPASGVIVIVNDSIIGLTSEKTITLENIQPGQTHKVRLVPIKKTLLGDGVDIMIHAAKPIPKLTFPKAPNTGRQ